MKLVLAYILGYAALIFLFFVDHSAKSAYTPLKEGLLYSTSISSQTILNDEVTEKTLFKRDGEDDYLVIEAATAEKLPPKFLVRVIEPKDAKYRLIAGAEAAGRPQLAGKPLPPVKSDARALKWAITAPAEQAKAAIAATTVQKEIPQEVLNVNKVRDIVKNSEKTYFFPGIEKTLDDVTFAVKSVTPWQNKSILTMELNNNQSGYFFISNLGLSAAGAPLAGENFNDPFVLGKTKVTFFIITRQLKSEAIAVRLSESRGANRRFELPVAIP